MLARGDSKTLRVPRAPLNSGFSRKSREKRLEFRTGLYCNKTSILPRQQLLQSLYFRRTVIALFRKFVKDPFKQRVL